jgi:hypothetical protein
MDIKCRTAHSTRATTFFKKAALKKHHVCVALEINGIHPTYNVAPRKIFMETFNLPLFRAGAVLKNLNLDLSYVHTVANPYPGAMG